MILIFNYWPEILAILVLGLSYSLIFREESWVKLIISTIIAVSLAFIIYGSLGNSKPIFLDYQIISGDLIAYKAIENKKIYLYLSLDKVDEPLSLSIPWTMKKADSLDLANQDAIQNHRKMHIVIGNKRLRKKIPDIVKKYFQSSDSLSSGDEAQKGDSLDITLSTIPKEPTK